MHDILEPTPYSTGLFLFTNSNFTSYRAQASVWPPCRSFRKPEMLSMERHQWGIDIVSNMGGRERLSPTVYFISDAILRANIVLCRLNFLPLSKDAIFCALAKFITNRTSRKATHETIAKTLILLSRKSKIDLDYSKIRASFRGDFPFSEFLVASSALAQLHLCIRPFCSLWNYPSNNRIMQALQHHANGKEFIKASNLLDAADQIIRDCVQQSFVSRLINSVCAHSDLMKKVLVDLFVSGALRIFKTYWVQKVHTSFPISFDFKLSRWAYNRYNRFKEATAQGRGKTYHTSETI